MTRKEVFLKVKNHLLTQNARSTNRKVRDRNGQSVGCAYRGDQGRMCAVGCLISDEFYRTDLENLNCDVYAVQEALTLSGVVLDTGTKHMLREIQSIHDNEVTESWAMLLDRAETKFVF